jgi:hypothetical protein
MQSTKLVRNAANTLMYKNPADYVEYTCSVQLHNNTNCAAFAYNMQQFAALHNAFTLVLLCAYNYALPGTQQNTTQALSMLYNITCTTHSVASITAMCNKQQKRLAVACICNMRYMLRADTRLVCAYTQQLMQQCIAAYKTAYAY